MLYSQYIWDLDHWFWKTAEGLLVKSKIASKSLAQAHGVPVPLTLAMFSLPANAILKPDKEHSARGVLCLQRPGEYLVEEQLKDEACQEGLRTIRCYVLQGKVRIVQVVAPMKLPSTQMSGAGYYLYPEWKPALIDTKRPWYHSEPPWCMPQIAAHARRLADQFRSLSTIRVDFFATSEGAKFNEFAATPGVVIGKRIDPEWDATMGGWINE